MGSLRILCHLLVVSCLLAAGLIVLADTAFIQRYGMDYSDACAVVGGEVAEWPTGERPLWAYAPAWTYALIPLLAAGVFGALHPSRSVWPETRQCRGCE